MNIFKDIVNAVVLCITAFTIYVASLHLLQYRSNHTLLQINIRQGNSQSPNVAVVCIKENDLNRTIEVDLDSYLPNNQVYTGDSGC